MCSSCRDAVTRAYHFRNKVVAALSYWRKKFSSSICEVKSEFFDFDKPDSNVNSVILTTAVKKENSVAENEVDKSTNFSCSKCNSVFATASELLHHHCNVADKPKSSHQKIKLNKSKFKIKGHSFRCYFCDEVFTIKWKLTKHLQTYHSSERKFVCVICGRAFKQSHHLREHVTSHTGERNYNCDICDKSFQRKSSQQRHMKSHNAIPGEKAKKCPFLCTICGKRFPYSNGAQRHMRTHSGDKRFQCKICEKRFNQTTHLKVHLTTHTGEKLYVCVECGDSFKVNATLQKHMKKHQKKSEEDVQICQNLEPNLSQNTAFEKNLIKNSEIILGDNFSIGYEEKIYERPLIDNFKIELENKINFHEEFLP